MANQNLYNQILSGWGSSGVGDDWTGVWDEYTNAPTAPDWWQDYQDLLNKETGSATGRLAKTLRLATYRNNPEYSTYKTALDEYNTNYPMWNEAFGGLD